MTRRWALASALLLTAIFSFFVIAYGSSAGVFAWSRGDSEAAPDVAFESDGRTPVATVPPRIVTEFVYVDETVEARQAVSESDGDEDEWYEDDHDDDDDDHEEEDEEEYGDDHHDDDDDHEDHNDDD